MMIEEKAILKPAIFSRVALIIIQYFGNIIIPDHIPVVFRCPKSRTDETAAENVVEHFLGGLVRWDAQYFMHIAKYGYTYENTLAFFPLYPISVRLISTCIRLIVPVVDLDPILLLVFVTLNIFSFLISVKFLYKITNTIFDRNIAYLTVILFSFNPASIFFIAPYSECTFCCLTFWSIRNCLLLYKKYSSVKYKFDFHDLFLLLPVGLSTITRSNGVLNIGFLIYACICIFIKHFKANKNFIDKLKISLTCIFVLITVSIICLIPFIVYQLYCFQMFCKNFDANLPINIINHATENNFILPGEYSKHNQSWCHSKIPLAYSYVQSHYWNVGSFKYYEFKQIPNFLLATPILYIMITNCMKHISHNFNQYANVLDIFTFERLFGKKRKSYRDLILDSQLNVFVIHALFLSLFCMIFIHIQVSTRMLCSSSPLFYWFCINYISEFKVKDLKSIFFNYASLKECAIKIYFISYFVIGTLLFCNFLPWT